MINNVTLLGRISNDLKMLQTVNQKNYLPFTVVVNQYFNGANEPHFIECVAWGRNAENIAQYFHKGDLIGLTGYLTVRKSNFEGRKINRMNVNVNNFTFVSSPKNKQQKNSAPSEQATEVSLNTIDDLLDKKFDNLTKNKENQNQEIDEDILWNE